MKILKYWGTLPWKSPFRIIGGACPPCPIGIDAPGCDKSAAMRSDEAR